MTHEEVKKVVVAMQETKEIHGLEFRGDYWWYLDSIGNVFFSSTGSVVPNSVLLCKTTNGRIVFDYKAVGITKL